MNLQGHTILITGGSTGIGLAFAKRFVELGNEVIVTGRRQDRLDAAKAAVPALHTIVNDVGDIAGVKALAAEVKSRFPKLDVLMNNAGIMEVHDLSRPEDDLDALTHEIDIDLKGPIRLTSALIELLKANKGTIINVSSGLAWVPLPPTPMYCAAKAGLHAYTVSLRLQLEGTGVTVVELAPPAVKTELLDTPEGVKMMSTDELVSATIPALRAGKLEITPGQASQLRFMSRMAPGFIVGQLWKASKAMLKR